MTRQARIRIVGLVALCLAASGPRAHNASRGLHLHVEPDPAVPGSRVEVEVDAEGAMLRLRIGFVDQEPLTVTPEEPVSRLETTVAVPRADPGTTVSLQAEAETDDGRTLRASAVVRLEAGETGEDDGSP